MPSAYFDDRTPSLDEPPTPGTSVKASPTTVRCCRYQAPRDGTAQAALRVLFGYLGATGNFPVGTASLDDYSPFRRRAAVTTSWRV